MGYSATISHNSYDKLMLKERPMKKKVKVIRTGNSYAVTLPSEWIRENGIEAGDEILRDTTPAGELVFTKAVSEGQAKGISELIGYVEGLPKVPWLRPDTKEADREYWSRDYD